MNKKTPLVSPSQFQDLLLNWHHSSNERQMPWKGEKDAYRIWLSEIILQQTRVEQGTKYYLAFTKKFPDVHALASAKEETVFKTWEGLGYYTRCRNLIATARFISHELKGRFPDNLESIRALKGIGPYTAAAIASFAFDLPHPVLDGNVFRIFSRLLGIQTPIDSSAGKKEFASIAEHFLDRQAPAMYNQAIMDFGATICKPKSPLCSDCVFNTYCYAYNNDMIQVLPVKEKKLIIRKRWLNFFVIIHRDRIAIRKRDESDIWKGLYEFPLIETSKPSSDEDLLLAAQKESIIGNTYHANIKGKTITQMLTHQQIIGRFIQVNVESVPKLKDSLWVKIEKLEDYAFPKLLREYINEFVKVPSH